MRIDRRVVRRKDQYLVPIPADVRKHLTLVAGARIWWHISQRGMVALTTSGKTARGRVRLDTDCVSCEGHRKEIRRLQSRLPAQRQSAWEDAWRHYAMKKLSVELTGTPALSAINDRLRDIEAQLGIRRGPWNYQAKRGARRSPPAAGPDQLPPPDPPPSPVVAEAGADTSGRRAPGVPLET